MTSTKLPRSLRGSSPFPPSMVCNLKAIFDFALLAGANYALREFVLNSLYTFNATGGTTNDFSGTGPLTLMYEHYQVLRGKFKARVVSIDGTQPCSLGIIARDRQPSLAIASRANAINALEVAPTSKVHTVGVASGMSVINLPVFVIDGGEVLGNDIQFFSGIDYIGAFGADPTQKVWVDVVAYTNTGGS